MSLFGGDGSAPPTESPFESESDHSQRSVARSSPSVAEHTSLQSAQPAQIDHQPLESDADDDLYTDSEADLDESDEEQPTRPNRFTGQPQTWKSYTAADRQIAASLEQIQDSDLAAHLYNAHSLKRRVRRPADDLTGLKSWQSKDNWSKTGTDLQYTDVSGLVQTELVPSKDWTAWPLPPANHPGFNDRSGRGLVDGEPRQWVVGGANTQDAGEELRDELLAVFLRLARESWNSRDTESETSRGRHRTSMSQSRSRSKSATSNKSHRSAARTDVEMEDGDDLETDDAEAQDDDEEKQGHTAGGKRGRKPQTETFAKPTILADDARARRLLQPSIQSMLSKLDDLAMAVRRTRLNHFGRGGSSDQSSQSEFTSGAESTGPGSRSSSRAGSRTASKKPNSRPSSRAGPSTNKGKNALKNQQAGSDSDSDYGNLSGSNTSSNPQARKRVRSESTASADSASTARDWSGRAGLMDWSEVLGLAAVKGWDERAVARTAQRCAALFGESMSFLPFNEDFALKTVPEPVHYTPCVIAAPEAPFISGPPTTKRPFFQVGTLRCPHTDCFGHEKDFALPYRVIEHCIRVHGYDPRTNDSENEERKVGGVHIDGFLHPVTVKPGWLGHGRSKASKASKKQKMGQEDGASASEAMQSIESLTGQ